MSALWDAAAFAQGFWAGVFQLIGLAILATFGNLVYQRVKARYALRQELIDEINEFAINLYKPRKMYQSLIEGDNDPLARIADAQQREARRLEIVSRATEEVVAATGRFRAVQVKIIPLYGHDLELFGYYMAIWQYLKEIRHRMTQCESLYSATEEVGSQDALYMLIDTFRYRVMLRRFNWEKPPLSRPPQDVLEAMRRRGDEVYAEYFGTPKKVPEPVAT
jgi:hypothetical protein